jgi:addiction module HigA family antidote
VSWYFLRFIGMLRDPLTPPSANTACFSNFIGLNPPNAERRRRRCRHYLHNWRLTFRFEASRLGVSRLTVSALLLEKRALSPDMAIRLARLLDTTSEFWLNMQQALDLWEVETRGARKYARIEAIAA